MTEKYTVVCTDDGGDVSVEQIETENLNEALLKIEEDGRDAEKWVEKVFKGWCEEVPFDLTGNPEEEASK